MRQFGRIGLALAGNPWGWITDPLAVAPTRTNDPKMYTKPFSITYRQRLVPDGDVLEYVCEENEKDQTHMAKP